MAQMSVSAGNLHSLLLDFSVLGEDTNEHRESIYFSKIDVKRRDKETSKASEIRTFLQIDVKILDKETSKASEIDLFLQIDENQGRSFRYAAKL